MEKSPDELSHHMFWYKPDRKAHTDDYEVDNIQSVRVKPSLPVPQAAHQEQMRRGPGHAKDMASVPMEAASRFCTAGRRARLPCTCQMEWGSKWGKAPKSTILSFRLVQTGTILTIPGFCWQPLL